ncbi:hypothetical protein [Streptomyces sp. NPDC018833]|uniref:hypothetical protein n=1 Tax=Streptomyces sp. NPDC018833 TaxID=3365053 RepID=UPI00378ED6DB
MSRSPGLADAVRTRGAGLPGRTRRPGGSGRPALAGDTLYARRSGGTDRSLAGFASTPGRAGDRLLAQLLHLRGQRIPGGVRLAQVGRKVLHGEHRRGGEQRSKDGQQVALP